MLLVLGWRCPMAATATRPQAHHQHTEHEGPRMQSSPKGRGSGTEPGARRRCQPVRWTCHKEVVHAITNMAVDHDDQPPATLIPRALVDREQHPLGPRRNVQRRAGRVRTRQMPSPFWPPSVTLAQHDAPPSSTRPPPSDSSTRTEIGTNLRRDAAPIDSMDHAQFGSQSPQDICQHLRNT
jgi:hypothetical protein